MPPGQSKRARIERALEFWRDKRIQRVLLSDGTIAVFGKLVSQCASTTTFGFEHVYALVMAVSLIESQMRDCIRLAVDDVRFPVDLNHPLFKELSIDASLFVSLRDRSFTLGEFVFLNTGVSTVPQLWTAMEFCFPIEIDVAFEHFRTDNKIELVDTLDSLKSGLAQLFIQRNKQVHELFDETVEWFGSSEGLDRISFSIECAHLFLKWVQSMKIERFSGEYAELNSPRGDTAREINQARARIEEKIRRIDRFLRVERSEDDREIRFLEGLQRTFPKLISIQQEFAHYASEFIYYGVGPGTMAIDVAWGRMLIELQHFETLLDRAIEWKEMPE